MSRGGSLGTILVTGGAGWLGSYIVELLVNDSDFSQVVSSVEPQVTPNRQIPGVIYHDCDISNSTQLRALLDKVKPRIIIHSIGPGFFASPEAHRRVTYDLSKQLIAEARKHPSIQAVVYTGTVEGMNMTPKDNTRPMREDEVTLHSLHSGPNAYSRTKAAVDRLMREANTPEALDNTSGNYENQLLTTVLRVTGLYGPRDRLTVVEMLKLVNTPNTKFQLGPNTLVHDWIHVENCARAHVLAAKALVNPTGERADGRGFFVSDGKPKKFWDFTRKIWEEAGDANWAPDGPHKVIQIPFWLVLFAVGSIEWLFWIFTLGMVRPSASTMTFEYMKTGGWFDISETRNVLGYEPEFDTDEGIRRTIQWFKENGGWNKDV
ncbi:similar to C-3 sterol dehydrogenase/C-4 decarboxylase [Plenodomus lingam JN3]|uniref:Similar to C-3 sterol dehydrogenase/C-4 decarboxylase n=1 Tax=Leptosphaeria maculans (strain JN3 / isolate v23.1.3 / race Av1-4-5-6-7-8) TaxID=985895 RepID=E5A7D0_LEPMJ|nr:similar to C-3 sterol dehydrogenase/C-4 decarboxylase [Plenodomus lingam JN3]CBX99525.1 similar to C-3 sterol dehydrogenase/C-4 decarboxylase [Plenodomus lingam JN3]